jgi:hypothetical protein
MSVDTEKERLARGQRSCTPPMTITLSSPFYTSTILSVSAKMSIEKDVQRINKCTTILKRLQVVGDLQQAFTKVR